MGGGKKEVHWANEMLPRVWKQTLRGQTVPASGSDIAQL